MISSIDIKNFKNLDGLQINSFTNINLIAGKNNTGKSTLLEAIALYVTEIDTNTLFKILNERSEIYREIIRDENVIENNIKAISSLFTGRTMGFGEKDIISIGELENSLFGEQISSTKSINLRFVKYIESPNEYNENKGVIIENENNKNIIDYKLGLEINIKNNSYVLSLKNNLRFIHNKSTSTKNFQFISTKNIDDNTNAKLWDNISLTDKEQFVVDALKIIEPLVEKIAFVELTSRSRSRSAIIKLSNSSDKFSLGSMGDGINRILTIILALVNSDKGYLLIDEFENGLHHSTQAKLWEIIFYLADKLKVQVFATTHSNDCIAGFEKALNNKENNIDGKLIRLINNKGKIKYVEYDEEELKITTENNIETR